MNGQLTIALKNKEKNTGKKLNHIQVSRLAKLSKNFKAFSESEIESGNLVLKNSEIRRVVTKWCEELEQYYDPTYLFVKSKFIRMKDGSEKSFFNNIEYNLKSEGEAIEQQVRK